MWIAQQVFGFVENNRSEAQRREDVASGAKGAEIPNSLSNSF